jgi:hypothetical protein
VSVRPALVRAAPLLCASLLASPAAAEPPAAAAPPAAVEAPDAAYQQSPEGHRFRVGFDPASRVSLGLAGAATRGHTGAPAAAPEVTAGVSYRTFRASGLGRDRVSWQVDHRVLEGWVQPLARPAGLPAFDAALYRVDLLRHDGSPSVVLPMSPPVGIPFPFDVGLATEVGRVTSPAFAPAARGAATPVPALHVGVVKAALLLDPWRSGVPGRSFEIGIGARYDLDLEGAPTLASPRVIHRVAPMTAGSLRFRIQSRDGLSLADVRGEVVPHWTSEGAWAFLAQSAVRLERVILAVNDQPIAAVLDGGYRRYPATRGAEGSSDFRVSLGLSLDLALR